MRIPSRFRRVCLPSLILISLGLFASSCGAVTMRITAGFDGVIKSTRWAPVAVQLANPSDEDIEAVLNVVEPDISTPIPVCTTPVNLPAHSTKLYHAYVRLPQYGGKLVVSLTRGFGTLATQETKVSAAADDDRLIVTIGDRASRLSFMQGETLQGVQRPPMPGQSGSSQATIHAASLSPAALPDRPAAYEGADVMVVSGLSPESTDPNALKAICSWVASGGTLVVSTGPDYRAYTNPFYDEILPVRIAGATNVQGIQGISSICGGPSPTGPAAIAKSTVKPGIGSVVCSASGNPLIAERRYGAGKVIFLAFDIKASPFMDWNGQIKFWKNLIADSSFDPLARTEDRFSGDDFSGPYGGGYRNDNMSAFRNVIAQAASVETPSIATVGLFLVAYLIVLVPINYAVLRVRRRLEWAWVTTPAIVLLFTIGAYAIGYTMKGGELKLSEASLVEGSSNARFARVVTDASVFSPARRSYDISVCDPAAISQVIPMSKDDEPQLTYLGESSIIGGVGMAMWSSKAFEAVGGTDLGGVIESNLTLNGSRLSGRITNNTGIDLHDCTVYCGTGRARLARLPKGGVLKVNLTSPQTTGPRTPYDPYYGDKRVRDRLDAFVQANALDSGPVLVGFADAKGVYDVAGKHPAVDRSTCYVFHLDYAQGSVIAIAPGMVKAWSEGSGGPGVNSGNGMLTSYFYGDRAFVGVYRLPVPAGYRVTSLKVVGRINGTDKPGVSKGVIDVSALNRRTGHWDAIAIPSSASLPNPADYVSAIGDVKVRYAARSHAINVKCGLSAEAKRL